MSGLWNDIKFALRTLIKKPSYVIVVVFTLAIGIGANTTIFSFVNGVLFKPLPYPDVDRIIYMEETHPQFGTMSVSAPDYQDWHDRQQTFESFCGFQFTELNLSGFEYPERIKAVKVTADFFNVFEAKPILGRVFTKEDNQPSAAPTVVISYDFWQTKFSGKEDIIGTSITLHDNPHTVIGVMEREFHFPPYGIGAKKVWVPLGLSFDSNRGNHSGIYALGKLKVGVTHQQAKADLEQIVGQLQQEHPDTNATTGIKFRTLQDRLFEDVKPEMLYVLMAAVGFVLLIVCANIMNIVLAKSAERTREIALRTALGAKHVHILRQILCEMALLVLAGTGLGMLFSIWGLDTLISFMPEQAKGVRQAIALDHYVFGYTLLLSTFTLFIFGIAPFIQTLRISLNNSLKEGGRGAGSSRFANYFRHCLVAGQVCFALVLLCGSGLMIRSFINIMSADIGMDGHNVLAVTIELPKTKYTNNNQIQLFYDEIIHESRALPGVQSVAVTSSFNGSSTISYTVEGEPEPANGYAPTTDMTSVTTDYFDTLKMRLLAGSLFTGNERDGEKKVAVIDETMAKQYWGVTEAIGKRFRFGENDYYEIIGVVNHVKNHGVDNKSGHQAYFPMTQMMRSNSKLLVRTKSDANTFTGVLRDTLSKIDSSIPLDNISTVEAFYAERSMVKKMMASFMSFFAIAALLLAAFGIYGVMAYSVSLRTHEFGIRMALGANKSNVIRMVLKQGMPVVLTGIGIGLLLSFLLTQLIKSLLFQVNTFDIVTYLIVVGLLASTAFLAGLLPAWRAAKVDPMTSLRCE